MAFGLLCTASILACFTFQIASSTLNPQVFSGTECRQFFTYFETKSCNDGNTISVTPSMTFNSSAEHSILDDPSCPFGSPPEEQFMQLMCEDVHTLCTMNTPTIMDIETTVTSTFSTTDAETDTTLSSYQETSRVPASTETVLIESTTATMQTFIKTKCKQFLTYFEMKTCDGGNTTVVKPAAVVFETTEEYLFTDDPACPFGSPAQEQFLQLTCEEVHTVCNRSSLVGAVGQTADESSSNAAVIVGSIIGVGAASCLTYYAAVKIKDFIQSGTYIVK